MIDSLGASGAEHSTAALLPELRARGHQVSASTLYDAGFGDEESLRSAGFDVRPLASTGFTRRVAELRRRIRRERPDIVHTALFNSDQVGRVAATRTGATVISSLVNTPYDRFRLSEPSVDRRKIRAVQALDAATARLVDRFHAVSPGVAESNARALHLNPEKVRVAVRGRDRSRLGTFSAHRRDEARKSLGLVPDSPVVIAVGRQEFQKRHIDLLEAFDLLIDSHPDATLLLAGREGNATSDVTRTLNRLPRAAERTRLLGHRHDVPDLICAADLLVVSSSYEGTAGAALEALALNCPVVCTNLDGVKGILTHDRTALLTPVGDLLALSRTMNRVLTDGALATRLRHAGLAEFETRFTIDAATSEMVALYEWALEGREQ